MNYADVLEKIPLWELMVLLGAGAVFVVILILWVLFGYSWEITQVKPPTLEVSALTRLI